MEEAVDDGVLFPSKLNYNLPQGYATSYIPLPPDLDYDQAGSGIFNDDGTPVDMDSLQVPSKCMMCRRYYSENELDLICCKLMWADFRKGDDFECGSFLEI